MILQDEVKTKEQLISELAALRQRISELEALVIKHVEAQREIDRLLKTVETAREAIIITSADGTITYANQAMDELFGYQRGELIGKYPPVLNAGSAPEAVTKKIMDTIEKQGWWEGEIHNRRKDGTEFLSYARISALKDDDGKIVNFLSTQHDITERKQMEEALQIEKNKLQSVIGAMEYGLTVTVQDKDYNIIYQSGLTRMTSGDHLGEKCYRVYEGKEKICDGCPVEKAFRDGKSHTSERRLVMPSGEVTFWEVTANPVRDAGGRIVSCLKIARGITEHKRAEEALWRSEEKYRHLVEDSHAGIVTIDLEGKLTFANPALFNMMGYSEDEARGKYFLEFVAPDDRERVLQMYREGIASPQGVVSLECKLLRKTGDILHIHASISPLVDNGRFSGATAVVSDITQRKLAEEALRESEVKLRLMFESVTDGITVTDLDGFITALNERVLEMHGFRSKDEVLGKHAWEFIARRDHYKAAAHTRRTLEQGRPTAVEYTLVKADGSEFPGEISASLLKDAYGNLVGFIGIIRDITERKQAEEVLKGSEERYKSLVTNVKLGVFRSTPGRAGRFLEVNPAMEEITGYSREELLKMNVSDLYVHPERREAILEEVASATGKAAKELWLRKKDGTEIVVSDTKVAVRDDTGKILYFDGIIEDITERKLAEEREKQLQQQLYLSSRLAAIGELAAGVAHEINNPLTGILGFSQRLLRKSAEETQVRDLEIICNEAQRAAKVVENLLTFARCREPRKQYADINDILQKALELRAYQLKISNIEVALDLAPSLPKIMVDFHQIQEVFLNIILNAEQAISEANRGGKLGIKTQPVRDYIKISFADDGPGIPAEHLDKMFNPFFTTRRERGGTGLGLSVCHGIVAEHGGRIYAKSKPGKGATFFVELPVDQSSY